MCSTHRVNFEPHNTFQIITPLVEREVNMEVGERCGGEDKGEGEEVTNETKLIDFSFRRDHSVQQSVFGGFRALK